MGSGCVIWLGRTNRQGYGRMPGFRRGRAERFMHRLSWEAEHGPIPAGLCVLHRCDTPPCYNYEHLFLGTRRENSADMTSKGRHRNAKKQRCIRGHVFGATYDGHRCCLECARGRARARYARTREAANGLA